jgi:hypothetical protein
MVPDAVGKALVRGWRKKPVSSRLEDYRSFSYPPSGPPVHTAHYLTGKKPYGPQRQKENPKAKESAIY